MEFTCVKYYAVLPLHSSNTNTMTLASATEIVKSLNFEKVPTGWSFDYTRMAKAYKKAVVVVGHDAAVSHINYYLHHFRAYAK